MRCSLAYAPMGSMRVTPESQPILLYQHDAGSGSPAISVPIVTSNGDEGEKPKAAAEEDVYDQLSDEEWARHRPSMSGTQEDKPSKDETN